MDLLGLGILKLRGNDLKAKKLGFARDDSGRYSTVKEDHKKALKLALLI